MASLALLRVMSAATIPSASEPSRAPVDASAAARPRRGARVRLVVAIAGTIGLGLGLRLWGLTAHSLWYDEGWSLVYARSTGLLEALRRVAAGDGSERYQPLYFALLFAWRRLAGESEAALRALSVVLGALVVPVAFLIGRRLYGTAAGLLAGLLVAVSAHAVYYSQEVRPYALLTLLAAVQLWLFLRAAGAPAAPGGPGRSGTVAARRLFAAACGLFAFGSVFLVLTTLSLAVADRLAQPRADRPALWRRVALGTLPAVIYFAALRATAAGTSGVSELQQSPLFNGAFIVYGLLVGTTFGPSTLELRERHLAALTAHLPEMLVVVLLVAAIAAAAATGVARDRAGGRERGSTRFLVLLLAALFGSSALFVLGSRLNWLPRHASTMLVPLLVLAAGRGTELLMSARARRERWLGLATIGLFVGANLWSLERYHFDPAHRRDDYRGAVELLRHARGPTDRSVLLWGLPDLLRYYGDSATIDGRAWGPRTLAQRLRAATGGAPRVFALVEREFYWKHGASVARAVVPVYCVAGRRRVPYFTIYVLVLRSGSACGRAPDAAPPR